MPAQALALPGHCDPLNKNAIDFRNGLLAHASHTLVCVVDPEAVALVATLDGHRAKVTLVAWAPRPPTRCNLISEPLLLASADASGDVAVWDVLKGVALCWLADVPGAPISKGSARLHWLPHHANTLLCLHAPGALAAYSIHRAPDAPPQAPGYSLPTSTDPGATLLWQTTLGVRGTSFHNARVALRHFPTVLYSQYLV